MIKVLYKEEELKKFLGNIRKENKSIGFVPTMGALHDGHLKLVKNAKKNNSIVVVSIFVNPTQFNDKKDLDKYPRNLDNDVTLLENTGTDFVYAPSVEDVYPQGFNHDFEMDLGGLDKTMEGQHRPGHFQGVAQVVRRLLEIVSPDKLYMGQKDFQQLTIIQFMLTRLDLATQLIICPIIREANGLAMSSRNARLSEPARQFAGIIYKTLLAAKRMKKNKSPHEISAYVSKKLNVPSMTMEYFEIVDGYSLQHVFSWKDSNYIVACVAVKVEGVRLIDNIIMKSEKA